MGRLSKICINHSNSSICDTLSVDIRERNWHRMTDTKTEIRYSQNEGMSLFVSNSTESYGTSSHLPSETSTVSSALRVFRPQWHTVMSPIPLKRIAGVWKIWSRFSLVLRDALVCTKLIPFSVALFLHSLIFFPLSDTVWIFQQSRRPIPIQVKSTTSSTVLKVHSFIVLRRGCYVCWPEWTVLGSFKFGVSHGDHFVFYCQFVI